jgi:peptidyl-prolyl cis-trans isomerase A (cyclophilin A)
MLYAHFTTSEGNFTARLFDAETPNTVANFTGLADGSKEWTDPRSGRKVKQPYFNGTLFHRVIDGFMIQGGDPEGTGRGGPGYQFEDECPPGGPTFNQGGRLAMANAGPGTNGSQFFVTVGETPWLNGKHTIFGQVTDGYDVVESIAKTPVGRQDKPTEDVVIERIDIAD